jgi:hypothetical protein
MVLVRSLGKGRSAVPGCAWMRLAKPVVRPRQSSGQVDAQRPRRLPATMQRVKASTTQGCTNTASPWHLDSIFPGAWHHPGERTALGRSRLTWLAGWAADPGSGG